MFSFASSLCVRKMGEQNPRTCTRSPPPPYLLLFFSVFRLFSPLLFLRPWALLWFFLRVYDQRACRPVLAPVFPLFSDIPLLHSCRVVGLSSGFQISLSRSLIDSPRFFSFLTIYIRRGTDLSVKSIIFCHSYFTPSPFPGFFFPLPRLSRAFFPRGPVFVRQVRSRSVSPRHSFLSPGTSNVVIYFVPSGVETPPGYVPKFSPSSTSRAFVTCPLFFAGW